MSDAGSMAIGHFANGYNCCQSVLLSLCAPAGLDAALAVRLATGFGVGMARGGVCGAVSGAVMALGLFGGGGGPDGRAAKTATYARTKVLYDRFFERHGSILCRDLIGLDPSTPEGLELASRERRFHTVCVPLVRDAADLAWDIIESRGFVVG